MKKQDTPTPARRYTLGPDVDLSVEEIYEPDGTRITDQRAQQIAEETLEQVRRGRPSLGRGTVHSPQISIRVTTATRDQAAQRARAEGRTVSELTREALERYLAS